MAELTHPRGAETLRRVVSMCNVMRESFNDRFEAEELVQLYRAYEACGWDITPDEWMFPQVNDALDGYVPQWCPYSEEPLWLREHGPWQDPERYIGHPWHEY